MSPILKHPLSLYVVWHPDFKAGQKIAESIYETFCRRVDDPLSRGLGIPVYFRSAKVNGAPIDIPKTDSTRNAIIILLDQHFVIDSDSDSDFKAYVKRLAGLADRNTRIFPVKLCAEAGSVTALNPVQFIFPSLPARWTSATIDAAIEKIRTELLHDCARLLLDFHPAGDDTPQELANPSPVKLFLSHAKHDGTTTAINFKAFVDKNLKLNVFFDAVDIQDGDKWADQLEQNVKQSALVVFLTDAYASREWCRREVISAKRVKSPIVVVHAVEDGEERAFPYLGNIPTITIKDHSEQRFQEIVNLTLRQVINNCNQRELLQSFADFWKLDGSNFEFLASPPELFNYIDIVRKYERSKKKITVMYPEPPLGIEELQLLSEVDDRVSFVTPIQLGTNK